MIAKLFIIGIFLLTVDIGILIVVELKLYIAMSVKEREGKLTDLMSKDPRSAKFISDMANGTDPWIAVIERLDVDGVTDLMNDPSKQEAYAEANKEYYLNNIHTNH